MAGGFWMGMPKRNRLAHLMLDGEEPIELDFSGAVPRIAYGLNGMEPPSEDPYEIEGMEAIDREGRKKFLNALFWDSKKRTRLPQGTKPFFGQMTGKEAYALMTQHHTAIANWFSRSAGAELQYFESKIISMVTHRLLSQGMAALPIHDAVLIAKCRADEAERVMKDVFLEVCGGTAVVHRLTLEEA